MKISDLDDERKYMLMSSLNLCLKIKEKGYDKDDYMDFCSDIWNNVESNGKEKIDKIIEQFAMDGIRTLCNDIEEALCEKTSEIDDE